MRTMWLYQAMVAGTISIAAIAISVNATASPLSQDDVVPLVEQGDILPLAELLTRHQSKLAGRLIDLELEREHGRLVYELEVIDQQGIVREYLIDAKSGEWLGQE